MSIDAPDVPVVVDDLHDRLLAMGFEQATFRTGGMGGVQVVMEGPTRQGKGPMAVVQLTADRGQWVIALKFDGMKRFIDPAVWQDHLYEIPIGERDLVGEARFISQQLDDAANAAEQDPQIEATLVALGHRFMMGQASTSSDQPKR